MRKFWSESEVILLKKLYEEDGLSLSEIYPIFSVKYNRTLEAIGVKIGKLKLRHTKSQITKLKSRLNSGEGNGMFNKTSAMKGLTKENSEIVRLKSEKISTSRIKLFKEGKLPDLSGKNNPMYGSIAWNNGLTKHTDGRILNYGNKISIIKKKEWLDKTDDEKTIIINRLNRAMIQTKTPTKIEVKINDLLVGLNVEFIKNHRLGNFFVDFYLPKYNLVIECDGDYWHGNPMFYSNKTLTNVQLKNIDRDKRKNFMLTEANIDYLHFWEYDIHNNLNMVKNKIWESLQKKSILH